MKLLSIALIFFAIVMTPFNSTSAQDNKSPAELRRLAQAYYNWRNERFPVNSSDAGLHTWDDRLTDYSLSAILARRLEVKELLSKLRAMPAETWSKEDFIDWLLFRSQLEGIDFFNRVLNFEETDPQIYVNECSNGIFSLLKKDYDTTQNHRAGRPVNLGRGASLNSLPN
jgi:uncharacterized protein (DUF885 family)